jgi:ubiquinone/menaquinone biosynthesis C-methylase UbiE
MNAHAAVSIFTDREEVQQCLERQAGLFDSLTERLFQVAGLRPGMRVLDLGSGMGDVAMMAAWLVGFDGRVIGIERDPAAVAAATARVEWAKLSNVRFVQGDVQTLYGIEGGFDAVIGRLVLMYLPDPIAALARATELLRPGGLVCFQEADLAYDWAAPMTPLWTRMRALLLRTLIRTRVAPRMGLSLHSSFVAAGLPGPELQVGCAIGGDARAFAWANVLIGLLPLMERLGVATTADLEPDTLAERLLGDVLAAEGIVISPPLIGAWTHTPA